MRCLRLGLLVAVALTCANQVVAEEDKQHTAELQVLDHYVGDWHGKMQVPPTQENTQGLIVEGNVMAKWTVDGRWVMQEVDFDPAGGHPGMSVCTMMTYDAKTQKYRFITFQQDGSVNQASGTWDTTSKTMTSVLAPDPNGPVVTIKADFSKPGTETWKMIIHDPQGKVVGQIAGVNVKK